MTSISCQRQSDIQSEWTWIMFAFVTWTGSRPDVLSLLSQLWISVRNASTLHQSPLAISDATQPQWPTYRQQKRSSAAHTSPWLPLPFPPLLPFLLNTCNCGVLFPPFLLWRTGKALWIHGHWTLIGLMVVVYLNYLPSFMRVAVFMSAALGKLPPCPVIFQGTYLL